MVVRSTGHFTMGGEMECLEMVDGKLHYKINQLFDYPVEYDILLPEGRVVSMTIHRGMQEDIL